MRNLNMPTDQPEELPQETQDTPAGADNISFRKLTAGSIYSWVYRIIFILVTSYVLLADLLLIIDYAYDADEIRRLFHYFLLYSLLTLLLLVALKLKRPDLAERLLSNFYLRVIALFFGLLFVAHYYGFTNQVGENFSEDSLLIGAGTAILVSVFLFWGKPRILIAAISNSYFWFW